MEAQAAGQWLLRHLGASNSLDANCAPLSEADWQHICQIAIDQRCAPLLFQRLKQSSLASPLPTRVERRLREQYVACAFRNARRFSELASILAALQNGGIPIIVLKGAHLAQLVYIDTALRPMRDIDLLVQEADLPEVRRLLMAMGFPDDAKNDTEFSQLSAHYVYTSPQEGDLIEVHWDIQAPSSPVLTIDVEGIWQRARPATLGGAPALVLSAEDLLLHLCLHTSLHHLFDSVPVRSLCDIAVTVEHFGAELDWEQLLRRAGEWGATHCVYLTLYLVEKWLVAGIPSATLSALRPPGDDARFVAWAEERIFAGREDVRGPASNNWGEISASRGMRGKVGGGLSALFPAPRALARKYGLSGVPLQTALYYPVHIKDLVQRHGRRAWSLLRGDPQARAWLQRESSRVEERAVIDEVKHHDDRLHTWITEDPQRVRQLDVVTWLAER